MRLFSRSKPKIKAHTIKKDGYSGWIKCVHCHELIHAHELEKNLQCCPKCYHHYRMSAEQRVRLLADDDSFREMFAELQPIDPLEFVDLEPYHNRLIDAQTKSLRNEAVITGECLLKGEPIALAVFDFSFMAGSMGSVVGERLTLLMEFAFIKSIPLVIVSASGGARMQESMLSLMQMAKTTAALGKLHEKGIPYISILTHPTTGGVTASFASLGDVILAEPGALIGFAGQRVVEQVTGQKLPPHAQRAEMLLEQGMIDAIVPRYALKEQLHLVIGYFMGNERVFESLGARERDVGQSLGKLQQRLRELMDLSEVNG